MDILGGPWLVRRHERATARLAGEPARRYTRKEIMVRWYHAIFTAYGFLLPNDPRGSWSDFVGASELCGFGGAATKTQVRHSVAGVAHDPAFRRQAKMHLKHPGVRFDEEQRVCIASGIEKACEESSIHLHELAIGYDHAHTLVGRHTKTIEQVVQHFKSRATKEMTHRGCHPLQRYMNRDGSIPTPWAKNAWHVYINDDQQLGAAMEYIRRHPQKEGFPPQRWPFLTPV